MNQEVKRIVVLRTAPVEQISTALNKINEIYSTAKITCICQPEAVEIFESELEVNDFIPYHRKFFKLYYSWNLIKSIKKGKYDAIAFFYNNEAHKGYGHIEVFSFLTRVNNIFFGEANGEIITLSRWEFLRENIINKYFHFISNILVFVIIWLWMGLTALYCFFRKFSYAFLKRKEHMK